MKISPIFSLADPFIHTVQAINVFEDMGASHDAQHIGLFFRKIVCSEIQVDYKNPFVLNRFCKLYNFVNRRGTIYGHLFAVSDPTKLMLGKNKVIIKCNKVERLDYTQVPINSDKQPFLVFRTSTGTVLAISGYSTNHYLVTEPEL